LVGQRSERPGVLPAVAFMRSPAERRDQLLAWRRPDSAFFASGACHVLAFRFLARHASDRWRAVYLKPADGFPGTHVYATDGRWAFDFNGWVPERTLIDVTTAECQRRWPGWTAEQITLHEALEVFCQRWNHRHPSQFPFDPIPRADAFLDRFPRCPTSASHDGRRVELTLVAEDTDEYG
jgi:hypothetical protein